MQMTQIVQKIAKNDVKIIGRDSFMLMMLAYILVVAFILRAGLPWLDTYLTDNGVLPTEAFDFPLNEVFPMLVAYLSIYVGAVLIGVIFGFMLLDEKDDNTIKAMLVTPVSIGQYVTYRIVVATVISFVGVMVSMLIINQALVPLWQLVPIAAGASLTASISMLFFASFAENKVQGFAMTKFVGVSGLIILIGWFVPEPIQWLFGLFPPYWVVKSYWLALDGNGLWWLALVIGIVLQLGMIGWLIRRFQRVAYQ